MRTFGDVIREIGEFGLFQKQLLFVLCLPGLFAAFETIGQVFTGMSFAHRCNTDWILDRGNVSEELQRNLTLPVDAEGEFESCLMFTPVDWDLDAIETYGLNGTSGCLSGWDYDAPEGSSTIVTEVRKGEKTSESRSTRRFHHLCLSFAFFSQFDLVCEQQGMVAVSQSLYMAGHMISAMTMGAVSDR